MRKLFLASLYLTLALALPAPAAAASAAPAAAASNPPVTLTPDQARQALDVLNDPHRRAQVSDTLHAIAAAGALSAPPAATAAATAAVSTSAATASAAASAAAAASAPVAFKSNGLASQLARQSAHWLAQGAASLKRSVAVLLDMASVRAWWNNEIANPHERARVGRVVLAILGTLLPAVALEWLARRLLRPVRKAISARRMRHHEADDSPTTSASPSANATAGTTVHTTAPPAALAVNPATDPATSATQTTREVRSKRHAALHWTLLQRLPAAALQLLVRLLPLVVFVAAASVLMSILTDDGTPQDSALDTLIDLYVICRAIVIAGGFFLQPDAPALRLIPMQDTSAVFAQRWIISIVSTVGLGAALVEIGLAMGLSESAHGVLAKLVALAGHLLLCAMILQCRKPVAALIRERSHGSRPLALLGDGFVDAWTGVAIFIVMALWFVWALDVQNGYKTLLRLGGASVAVLIGARVVSIVVFGALSRAFRADQDATRSLVNQHAYRYYPLLRSIVYLAISIVTVLVLLQVWHVDVWQFFVVGTIGHRLVSALVTICVAAFVALFVWEAVNVSVERRLSDWTSSGDTVRAARLRTLLPMLRSALFVVIALVVVMTGLSELGVNTAPLLASASIFGVALGFGSQKLVQDFITGIFLLMENAMQVGDWVTLAGVSGTVEYLSIRTVRLRGGDGSLYTVPFSSVSTVNNTNRGLGNAAVKVNIAYGADLDLAIATLKEIGAALREDDQFKDGILSDFSFWGVDQVDGAALTLTGQIQCRDSARWPVQREVNRRIFEQFHARGIEIANPQRTVMVAKDGAVEALPLEARDAQQNRAAPGSN
ncbi:MAG TPA: mechanosensitive ion channel domain-containing protein [Paraburkholderia sp.]